MSDVENHGDHPVRKFFRILVSWATLFGLGLALVATGGVAAKWGMGMILVSLVYLAWELFSSKPIAKSVPAMLRFLFALIAVVVVVALNKTNIDLYFKPKPPIEAPKPKEEPQRSSTPTPTPASQGIKTSLFAIEIELSAVQEKRGFTLNRFYVTYISQSMSISPVDVFMFLRFVNLQSVPSTIMRYRVEIKIGKGEWLKLQNLPVRSMHLFWIGVPDGIAKAREFATDNALDTLLQGKAIPPHDLVRGWAYLDAPVSYSAPAGTPVQYRVTLWDAAGVKFTYESPLQKLALGQSPNGSDNVQSKEWHVLPGYHDLTSYSHKYFYEH